MSEQIRIQINGNVISVSEGIMVSAAIVNSGIHQFNKSVNSSPRAPMCGMGICYECCVTIDKINHCRSCQTPVREGMKIETSS